MNIAAAKMNLLCWLWCAALVSAILPARATVYDFSLGDAGSRTLRLNVPDSVTLVRGIVVYCNWSNGDVRAMATDPELVAFAQSMGFAVLATSHWTNFEYGYTPSEYSGWVYGLQQLAALSGHPEIVRAPWIPFGVSNGGQMSYGLNVWAPEKVIAMALNKAAIINDPLPASAALHTPGVLVAGELDATYGAGVHLVFVNNRPRGALWAWAEEQGIAHDTADSYELILPFMAEMYAARYPADASPQTDAVNLTPVNEADGWLTDPDSYKTGLAVIAPYSTYAKDKSVAGWLPNRRLAYIFRAFASYNKATPTATVSTGTGPVDWGTTITYTIGQPVASWTSIDFFEGDMQLKRVTFASGDSLSASLTPARAGYSVFHALVTLADGTQRTTMPRRVFVRAGPPLAPAIVSEPDDVAVMIGGPATFSAAATGFPAPAFQWRRNGVNLVNGANVSGATGTTLTISNVQAGDAGAYDLVATNSAGSATSAAATLAATTDKAPAAVILDGLDEIYTGGAQRVTAITSPDGLAVSFTYNGSPKAPVNAGSYTVVATISDAGHQGVASGTLVIAKAPLAAKANDQYKAPGAANPPLTVAYTGFVNGETVAALGAPPLASTTADASSPEGAYPIALTGGSAKNYVLTLEDGTLTVGLTPVAGTPGGVIDSRFVARWSEISGAAGYRLDVSTDSSFGNYVSGFQDLDVGNATSEVVTDLSPNATYYYRVRAYDSSGAGASSGAIAVTTMPIPVIAAPMPVSTLAGQALSSGGGDGVGSAARFNYLSAVAVDNAGNVYVADTDNHTIRKIVASTGAVTTFAGAAGVSGSADGVGSAARFNNPSGVAVDGEGIVYVADTMNHTLRRVTPLGIVTTLAGSPGIVGSVDGTGSDARFQGPQGLAIDDGGNLYVADTNNHTVRKVVPSTGVVTTVAGLAGNSGSADGQGGLARFDFPSGMAVDGAGNLFVADMENYTIRQILPSGLVSTVAGLAGASGGADGTGSTARFDSPSGVALDLSGNLYVADTDNHTIRKVVPSAGTVTTLAGLAGAAGSSDGLGSAVRFFSPTGIAADNSGNLYIADTNNDTVRAGLLATAPAIQTQPQSQTVRAGSSVQFSVTASGRPAVTYQWNFNGTAINEATSSSYSLSNTQSGNAGSYSVVVSNAMGSVASNQATLTVNAVTPPPNSGSGGGGGGGAPSTWFCCVLFLLAVVRIYQRRTKNEWPVNPACD
jgi:sugar lactone lactonase YvrE